jgi:23S rRNA pseudouridine2605 synthase
VPKTGKTRWLNVGRLDINTRGLLLFTDNGELVNRLTHPRYKIDREYAVRVFGDIREGALQRLREGVELDGEEFHFDDIVAGEGQGMNRWYYCVTQRGRNRMVRRLWESQGVRVSRLIRVRFGNIVLPRGLRAGDTVDVTAKDLGDLCRLVGMRV